MTDIISRLFCLFLKVSGTKSFPPPLPPEEEAECFRKAKKGDRKAREILIEQQSPPCCTYCQKILFHL